MPYLWSFTCTLRTHPYDFIDMERVAILYVREQPVIQHECCEEGETLITAVKPLYVIQHGLRLDLSN